MNPLMNDAERNSDDTGVMPKLATELQIELDRKLRAENLRIEDVLNENEMELYNQCKANAVKIMAATECSGLTVDADSPLQEEIQYLRRLPDIIPCVITTNYDTMIEQDLFEDRFKTYSQISDYYLSGSQGIGEVYKIHGSCTDPSTIILDDNDYRWFRDKAHIVSAKILSILCDYPMVIMEYAVEDRDIKEILNNLMSSLNDEKLGEVENNIVFIEYDPEEPGIVPSIRDVDDTWTRGGTEALDKNTNFDGVDCVVWTKETSDHSYTSWIGVDDGVLYYNEDVITIDGESATSTYRLVTCTFIDKL